MIKQNKIIEDHRAWLDQRSKMLSGYFSEPREDCYQSLCVYLLKYHSQATAWRKVFSDLQREEARRSLAASVTQETRGTPTPPPHQDTDRLDLLDYLPPLQRLTLELYWEGYTQKEISKKLEISKTMASRTLNRALNKIKNLLGES